jgi:hypothetical protein
MSALTQCRMYSDLEVDLRHFAEGQHYVYPQISKTVDPSEDKMIRYEHRSELQPDNEVLGHGSRKKQTKKRTCGLSLLEFWVIGYRCYWCYRGRSSR